jgi:hypothetical protein
MTEVLRKLADRIRERFPALDVRTDQCEIVRIMVKGILVSIRQEDEEFKADVISLRHECDFETTVINTLKTSDLNEFQARLFKELSDL